MNRKFNFTLVVLVFVLSAKAQSHFGVQLLTDSFDTRWSKGSISISTEGLALSNTLNTGMYSNYLFSDGFSPKNKNAFLDLNTKHTKFNTALNNKLEYKLNNDLGLALKHNSFVAFKSENEFSKFILFGNKRFLDKTVSSEDLRFLSYTSYAAGLTKKYISHNRKWRMKSGLDIQLLSQMNEVNARQLSFYTAVNGEEIEANIEQLAISRNQKSVAGVGLNLNLDFEYKKSENSIISVDFHNLNFNHLLNTELFYLDSNFSFTGINSFGPRDSIFKSGYLENRINEEIEDRTEDTSFVSLPSNIYIAYSRSLGKGNIISTSFRTTDLGEFGSSVDLGFLKIWNPNIALKSTLGYGDFTGIIWREEFEYAFSKVSIKLDVLNLHSFILPDKTTSYSAAISISSQL